jgi:hypothetical protein
LASRAEEESAIGEPQFRFLILAVVPLGIVAFARAPDDVYKRGLRDKAAGTVVGEIGLFERSTLHRYLRSAPPASSAQRWR